MMIGCPHREELSRFAIGDLDGPRFAHIAAHVEQCRHCDATLHDLDTDLDPLVAGLRKPQDPTPDVPVELLDAARSLLVPKRPEDRPVPPRNVGSFELKEELGSGTFGTVYRAIDTELGREVAVKVLRAGRLARPEYVDRFLREARSAGRLSHPGIVALYQAGQTEDELKTRFVPTLQQSASVRSAYLARVSYGEPSGCSVALCIRSTTGSDDTLQHRLASIFTEMFRTDAYLDIIFIRDDQEQQLKRVCNAFYQIA